MIHLIKIENMEDKWNFISEFPFEDTIFLVSDTKSKLALESFFLEKKSFIAGYSVMRMQEFYRELFSRTHPDWQIVSKHFIGEMLIEFTSSHSSNWIKKIKNYKVFFNYLDQFLPILSHNEGPRLIKDWFKEEGQSAYMRWGSWYNLCEEFFNYIKEKKIFYESGLKGLLVDHITSFQNDSLFKKRIVADLGFNFDSLDQSILESVSQHMEVRIVVPFSKNPDISEENSYSFLEKNIPKTCIKIEEKSKKNKTLYLSLKNKTRLQEIKRVIAQVHSWLDKGIHSKDIALIAPHIEDYWFCLKPYCEKENIKVRKKSPSSLKSFPEVIHWISCIKYCLGLAQFSDLESISFYKNPSFNFKKFKSLYYNFPEKNLIPYLQSHIKNCEEKTTGRDFIDWALTLWPRDGNQDVLDLILQKFQDSDLDISLRRGQWLRYLSSSTLSDFDLNEEEPEGITCLSFNAMSSVRSSYVIVLGLEEEALNLHSQTGLTNQDKSSLLHELGFPLPFSYPEEQESYLFYFLQSSFFKEVVISASQANFSGEIQNISSFWFWFHKKYCQENTLTDIQNVWDNYKTQKDINHILNFLNYQKEESQFLIESLSKNKVPYKSLYPLEISYNSLNNYLTCPFIYSSIKNFRLKDHDDLTMEVSPSEFGIWVHKFLKDFSKYKTDSLESHIDQMKNEITEEMLPHKKEWNIIKYKLIVIFNNILEKEQDWKNKLPNLQTKGTEVKLDSFVYWNKERSCLDKQGIPIKGSIDRVDFNSDKKDYVVIDYKAGELTNISSWRKNYEFQLMLYASALKKGLIKGFEKGSIKAILYYNYKKTTIKGYIEKESPYAELGSNRARLYEEKQKLDEHFKWMNELIKDAIQSIDKGDFFPDPRDKKTCKECKRRSWCRATHLI